MTTVKLEFIEPITDKWTDKQRGDLTYLIGDGVEFSSLDHMVEYCNQHTLSYDFHFLAMKYLCNQRWEYYIRSMHNYRAELIKIENDTPLFIKHRNIWQMRAYLFAILFWQQHQVD